MVKILKVLSVGSLGTKNQISPFRMQQGESLRKEGLDVEYFNIDRHGVLGYLRKLPSLRKEIKKNKIDIIHAHYGLSGMLSVLQRKVPVVITFHGSDIWASNIRKISLIASHLSHWNIFISEKLQSHARGFRVKNSSIIPCGVDLETFYPTEKAQARNINNFDKNQKYVLFSSSFTNKVKNYPLAKDAMKYIPSAALIELKGYTLEEVNVLMNACDVLLVTSFFESGPLVVKEAMASNLPVVSTQVGDVQEAIQDTAACYLAKYDPTDVADKLKKALEFGKKTNGREKIGKYRMDVIARRLKDLYSNILDK